MQTLKQRRDEADLVLVYKIQHNKCTVNGDRWFKIDDTMAGPHTRSAATGVRIRPQFARTDRRKNFFTVRVCEKWNNLPAEVTNAQSIANFKRAYRLFAAEQPLMAMEKARDQQGAANNDRRTASSQGSRRVAEDFATSK
jgi:hypothetical protein